MQFFPRDPSISAPPTLVHRDVDTMHDDYLNHVVSDDARGTLVPNYVSVAYGYIQWYFRVSHLYMTMNALGDPPMTTHQEIL